MSITYSQASAFLSLFTNNERSLSYDYSTFDLGRVRKLASLLGDPHKGIASIHVAGSKGKGSTASFLDSILRCAGYRTGLYTSPHLVEFEERIRVGGAPITKRAVCGLIPRVERAVRAMGMDRPTFFEIYTVMAFLYFKSQKVDIAVYETGLGGRLDATNIVEPSVSVITPISFEHTDKLGTTLSKIAAEKAGILKEGIPSVTAPQPQEAYAVIKRIAARKRSLLWTVGRDTTFKTISLSSSGSHFSYRGKSLYLPDVKTRLLGEHQVMNASTAITAIEALGSRSMIVKKQAILDGIYRTRWPGRLEIIARDPLVILDGAHNRASALALMKALKTLFPGRKITLVFGISRDKAVREVIGAVAPSVDKIILTRADVPGRAMEPDEISDVIAGISARFEAKIISRCRSVKEALTAAFSSTIKKDLILVTGSLFLVGEAKESLGELDG